MKVLIFIFIFILIMTTSFTVFASGNIMECKVSIDNFDEMRGLFKAPLRKYHLKRKVVRVDLTEYCEHGIPISIMKEGGTAQNGRISACMDGEKNFESYLFDGFTGALLDCDEI